MRVSACNLMISSRNFDDGNWGMGKGETARKRGEERERTKRKRGVRVSVCTCNNVEERVGQGRLVAHAQNLAGETRKNR